MYLSLLLSIYVSLFISNCISKSDLINDLSVYVNLSTSIYLSISLHYIYIYYTFNPIEVFYNLRFHDVLQTIYIRKKCFEAEILTKLS